MKTVLFIIALVLILIWTIGFVGYKIGGAFNGILILAIILETTGIIGELRQNNKLNGRQINEV